MADPPSPSPQAHWKRVASVLANAMEQPADERASWLDEACAGDDDLRREVERLLAADAQAGTFLDTGGSGAGGGATVETVSVAEAPGLASGRRVGPYEIVRELGQGGMGVVYLARRVDHAFEKLVAIKVVHGGLATDVAHARFGDERRILATLDHPNIARLLDGGTTPDGLSYIVMEYVDGLPLDAYCEAMRLPLTERLRLFRHVCAAVRYAHQRLVIHRDVKSRNILVTAEGTPKLLDFGIAKLLDDRWSGDQTRRGLRAFTLENASPEQIRGEPMTVTSDVYALGVLLYHLLTGHRPCGATATTDTDLMRAICDEPPVRPAVAARSGTGFTVSTELEWILLKAIRKEPERRYESVDKLDEDIDRWLTGRPVLAAPDSRRYRVRKFVSRHRTTVAAAALLAASLVAGVTTTLWQARRADRRFNDVRRLAHTFLFDVHDAIEPLPGSTSARRLLVSTALAYLDSLAREAASDQSLLRELATSYERMADVLGNPNTPNLGDLRGALAAYRKAQTARELLVAATPADADLRRDVSATASKMARVLHLTGELEPGLEQARIARTLAQGLAATAPGPEAQLRLASSYATEAFMLAASNATKDSVDRFGQAIAILEPLQSEPGDAFKLRLATTYSDFGRVLCDGSPVAGLVPDPARCLEMYRRSNAIEARLAQVDPSNLRLQRAVFVGELQVGEGFVLLGDLAAAVPYFRRGCSAGERLAGLDPANLQAQSDFAAACQHLGTALGKTGSPGEALVLLERSVKVLEPVLAADPGHLGTRARLAEANEGLGFAHGALATNRAFSLEARARHWSDAKSRFNDGRAFWVEMRDRGLTTGREQEYPERLAREIAACDAALAGLLAR
jgi:non-specific serine/threonine protein kinase/serine/threonine-protein kinase